MNQGDDDKIRRKAYEIWEDEGRPEGRHDDHWRQAREHYVQDKSAPNISGEKSGTAAAADATPSDVAPAEEASPDVSAADQPGDFDTQDKAMIPENSAEKLTQTAQPEPGSAPTPPAKRPRTQRKKTPAS